MSKPILVAVAWPYANAEIHVGNISGAYLPADIFARYHRLLGNQVLMVSGSDAHGTPITVRADSEAKSPEEIYSYYHEGFLKLFVDLGITYDLFTTTHSDNHFNVAQTVFNRLLENGFLYSEIEQQWYSSKLNRFLPDRYIEGTCYLCGYDEARGDQCDSCGHILDGKKLLQPRSKTGDKSLELRETEHYFIDLAKLSDQISHYLSTDKSHWRDNVLKPSLYTVDEIGLHGRAITRDLDWGIPVPLNGWDDKCLYVWFEAVIGYLSASIEWASNNNEPFSWHQWWYNDDCLSYYFIGKDNIPFHAVIWPAELIGVSQLSGDDLSTKLNLPYDVPANEFMNLEGEKISGSRNWAVWGLDVVERYGADAVRYYLTVNMPETKDTDWSWSDFQQRNNDQLVATWGNLVNRVLNFAYKNFDAKVPDPKKLRNEDQTLLNTIDQGFDEIGRLIELVKMRQALQEAFRLAAEVNKYLEDQAPWFTIKSDLDEASKSIYTALRAIDSLKIVFSPFLPFSSDQLHVYLGYKGSLFGDQSIRNVQDKRWSRSLLEYSHKGATGLWKPSELPVGQEIHKPDTLFQKLDEEIIEQEMSRLGD
tara:strand:+ start:7972 stop:9744 length:1773 start_codon:yes stop_codon:yes gene_type:complete